MESINPCSCGSTHAQPVVEHRMDSIWYGRVECPDCDNVGPERQSMDHEVCERLAIESWNLSIPLPREEWDPHAA